MGITTSKTSKLTITFLVPNLVLNLIERKKLAKGSIKIAKTLTKKMKSHILSDIKSKFIIKSNLRGWFNLTLRQLKKLSSESFIYGSVKISGRNWPTFWFGSRWSSEPVIIFSIPTWPSQNATLARCEWRKWPLG